MKKKKSNLSILMNYAGSYKRLTISSLILSFISSLITLVPFIYLWKIIEEVLKVSPNFSDAINIKHYGYMALIWSLIAIAVYIGALMCSHMSAFRVASSIKKKTINHIAGIPAGKIDEIGSGKLRKIVNESSAATETYLAHMLPDKAGAIATPLGLVVLLFVFDWRLGSLCLVPVVLGFAIMMAMTGKRMKEKMKEYNNSLGIMANEATEYIRGIPVVKVFGQTFFSFKKFKESIDDYQKWVISYTKDLRAPMVGYTTAINSVFAVLIAGGFFFINGSNIAEFSNLLFYVIITPVISVALTKIMFSSENGMIVGDAINRINSILNIKPLPDTKNKKEIKKHDINISNITFSYDGKRNVIDDVSLKIKDNSTVAFVGPSGSGKTTLASLISRFYDVDEGKIEIDGINIKEIPISELMDTLSFAFQDTKLIKGSILDNVRIGKKDASIEEVEHALHLAECDDIIEKFPDGINTIIGTKGVYFSGGEIQRIALARIIINDAPILILDEATAYADPDNEEKIQKAFSNIAKTKTVIMIAHRLSTIKNVDNIVVLVDGKIKEAGKHEVLLAQKGLYYNMWNDYNKSINWKVSKEAE